MIFKKVICKLTFLGALAGTIAIAGGCKDGTQSGSVTMGSREQPSLGADNFANDTTIVNTYLDQAQQLLKNKNIDRSMRVDSAIRLARDAASLSSAVGYHKGFVNAIIGIYTLNFINLEHFTINKDSLYLAIAVCNKIGDPAIRNARLVILYNMIGSFYNSTSDYDSTISYYLKAISLEETVPHPDTPTLGMLYNNIGFASALSGYSSDDAIAYYRKALSVALPIHDSNQLGHSYENIGEYYHQMKKQYDSAFWYWNNALPYYKKQAGLHRDLQRLYCSMAITSMCDQGDVQKAAEYISAAGNSFESDSARRHNDIYQFVKGEYHYHLREYREAIPFFERSLLLSQQEGKQDRVINNYINLAKCYDSAGNYKKASYYKTLAYNTQEAIKNTTIAQTIAQTRAKYELASKDKMLAENRIKLLQQQNSIQRQYFLTGIIGLAAVLLIGILSVLLFRKRNKVKMEQLKGVLAGEERERKRLAQELHDGIVSQLSAIRMNLSALSSQNETIRNASGYTEALDQLEQGIMELRNTSHNLMPAIFEQIGLVAAVKSFCGNLNQSSDVHIEFQEIGELPDIAASKALHIYRILQELIFNIIKHSNATNILVQFRTADARFQITIDDDSTQQQEQEEQAGAGIGRHNILDRMELLGGKMEIEHAPAGTSVYLEFDLNSKHIWLK